MVPTAVRNSKATMENTLGMFAQEKRFYFVLYGVKDRETCN